LAEEWKLLYCLNISKLEVKFFPTKREWCKGYWRSQTNYLLIKAVEFIFLKFLFYVICFSPGHLVIVIIAYLVLITSSIVGTSLPNCYGLIDILGEHLYEEPYFVVWNRGFCWQIIENLFHFLLILSMLPYILSLFLISFLFLVSYKRNQRNAHTQSMYSCGFFSMLAEQVQ
jgi:hypothetical protein